MKKSLLITLCFGVLIAVSLAFTNDSKSDEPWKNLKVLPQDITQKQMDSVMDHFSKSLNVSCDFCHIENKADQSMDYVTDKNKHKLVARDMMRMTDSINDRYFDLTGAKRTLNTQLMVTCFTCHNGRKEPLRIPR